MRDPHQVMGISRFQKRNLGYHCMPRSGSVAARQRRDLPSPAPSMHSPSVIPKVRALTLLAFLLALCLAALPSLAHADPDPRAKPTNPVALAHFQSGNRLFRVREFDKAVAEYKAGALLEDAPVFQYNLAQAYRMAGQYDEALWHYENFLGRLPADDPNRAKVKELMAQVKAEKGKPAPSQPQQVSFSVGGLPPISAPSPTERKAVRNRSNLPWILTGSAVLVAGGSSVAVDIWAQNTYDKAEASKAQTERNSLEDSANSRRHVAQGLAIATVGLAGATIYLFVRSRHGEKPESRLATVVSPYFTDQSSGLSVSGGW